jgi:hypothetical protein
LLTMASSASLPPFNNCMNHNKSNIIS